MQPRDILSSFLRIQKYFESDSLGGGEGVIGASKEACLY